MADKTADRGTVFISYSHKDEVWKDQLVDHLAPVRQAGLLEVWDDQGIRAGEDWRTEIKKAIEQTSIALLLISPDWLTSTTWVQEVEIPRLLERASRGEVRLIPVIVRPCSWENIEWLRHFQVWPPDGKPLASLRAKARDSSLVELAHQINSLVGAISPGLSRPLAEPRVSISRFPTTNQELFGREAELKALDDAWENPQVRVVNIMGMGGIGKTALVGHWLSSMARDWYRGAEQVFAWSFQDAPGNAFLFEALRAFGDPQAESFALQGERLIMQVRERRTLLILDDLEAFTPSSFKSSLLRSLSSGHRGLVVLISRLTLAKDSDSQRVLRLAGLTPDVGAALLRSLGIQGTEQELAAASRELEGHPLALTLLGASLRQTYGGDIRQIGRLTGPDAPLRNTEVVQRMLGEYEKSLEPAGLALLWIHVLFDRPITHEELAVLLSPPIPRLTDVPGLQSEPGRTAVFEKLTALGLLSQASPEAGSTSRIHTLVREHFQTRLREERPEAYRQGHERLFRHLTSKVSGQPQSLEDMSPLISAVAHGCAAGLHGEALKLYRDRISNGDEQHLTRKFGAPEADLQVLAHFFDSPWSRPRTDLAEDDAVFLLKSAGVALERAGKPREALVPTAAILERARTASQSAAIHWAACHQSAIQLSLGNLGQALIDAQSAIELAEKSSSIEQLSAARTVLADALHQAGRIKEAGNAIRDFDLPSYRSFDLLLSQGRFRLVLKQASTQRSLAEQSGFLPRVGLFHLALGRAQMEEDLDSARPHLDRAVQILLPGGARHWLTAALIARASLLLRRGRLDEAGSDLSQALEHATRSELRLQEADAHIGFARLHLATNDSDRARQSLSRARTIVDETGYHRRDDELQKLEAQLSSAAAESPLDPVTLAFRLVLAGHALPDLLLRPDLQKIEEAARRLTDEPGEPLLRAQRILEEQQPGILPNPLWASWITVTQGKALQQAGRKGQA